MRINIDEYLPYGRYYRFESNQENFAWWFCILDRKMYSTDDIYIYFNYSSIEDIVLSEHFIKFFTTDIVEIKKQFLKTFYLKSIPKALNQLDDESFDIAFNDFIDRNLMIKQWYDFERDVLRRDAERWAIDNHIQFYS